MKDTVRLRAAVPRIPQRIEAAVLRSHAEWGNTE
ncbi:hypothetical protein FHW84_004526 [Dyella sp. SG562]|nr:hypothetical protein [Dyella sp. SG562]NKJ19941.1 hypothetical protein [Dyella sp. SG609]